MGKLLKSYHTYQHYRYYAVCRTLLLTVMLVVEVMCHISNGSMQQWQQALVRRGCYCCVYSKKATAAMYCML
jgi:hypothetical protein